MTLNTSYLLFIVPFSVYGGDIAINGSQFSEIRTGLWMAQTETTYGEYNRYVVDQNPARTCRDTTLCSPIKLNGCSPDTGALLVRKRATDPVLALKDSINCSAIDSFAITRVRVEDAIEYANWLTNKVAKNEYCFRLPTYSEWLWSAYGTDRDYPWGVVNPDVSFVDDSDKVAVDCPFAEPRAVRNNCLFQVKRIAKAKTPNGIYGLWGNVSELFVPDSLNSLVLQKRMASRLTPRTIGVSYLETKFSPRDSSVGWLHDLPGRSVVVGFRLVAEKCLY